MKTMYIANNTNIVADLETGEISNMESSREGISRIYLIPENMKVIVKYGEKNIEFDAEKDDLLITFYESTFNKPAVIIKNADWVENIKSYNARIQAECEKWAAEKAATANSISNPDDECESC